MLTRTQFIRNKDFTLSSGLNLFYSNHHYYSSPSHLNTYTHQKQTSHTFTPLSKLKKPGRTQGHPFITSPKCVLQRRVKQIKTPKPSRETHRLRESHRLLNKPSIPETTGSPAFGYAVASSCKVERSGGKLFQT